MAEPTPLRVLIVEDNDDEAELLNRDTHIASEVRGQPVAVARATNLAEGIAFADHVDLIFADLMMPGSTPEDVVRGLKTQHSNAPLLVVTGLESDDAAWQAGQDLADGFLLKPVSPAQRRLSMVHAISKAAKLKEMRQKRRDKWIGFVNDMYGNEE